MAAIVTNDKYHPESWSMLLSCYSLFLFNRVITDGVHTMPVVGDVWMSMSIFVSSCMYISGKDYVVTKIGNLSNQKKKIKVWYIYFPKELAFPTWSFSIIDPMMKNR